MRTLKNQISLFDGKNKFQITSPVMLIELFSGIGAQAKAFENLGVDFTHYKICEIDDSAVKSYNAIHGTNFSVSDIKEIHASDLNINDDGFCYVMTYSFPCVDLSKAGKMKGLKEGTNSGLLWEVKRILTECKTLPHVLIMENVPEILSPKNKSDFNEWLCFLERLGYKNYYDVLNARNYGLPQNRNRCFCVTLLGDYYYTFPDETKLNKFFADYMDDSRGKVGDELEINKLILYKDKNCAHIKQATKKGYIVLQNYGAASLSFPNSEHRRGRVIKGGSVCPTITCATRDLSKFIDGEFYRISEREAWRLMGFTDDDFDKAQNAGVSKNQLYKQAGNSICVPVFESIIKAML